MKSSFANRFLNRSSATLAIALIAQCLPAAAQTGTWTGTGAGPNNWSAANQWSASSVANGASNSANFTSDIGQLTIVTLDSTRTIGNMTFSDAGAGGSAWLLRGTSTLTLDNGASQAVILKTTTTTISTPISGSNIRINGGATMNLLGNNTGITGTLTLGGTNGVIIANSNALGSATISHINGEVIGGTTRGIAISNPYNLGTYYWQGAFGLTLNGTLTVTGASQGFQTWAALTDTVQAGPVTLGANTLNVQGGAVGGIRITGNISGTGGVAKSGNSTLSLSGSNSYTGATTVTAGRLNFNPTANTSNLAISGTGTILAGEGTSSNAITLGAGTVLAIDPSSAGSLTTTGAVSIDSTVNLAFEPTQSLADGSTTVDVLKYGSLTGFSNLVLPSGLRAAMLNDDTANSKVSLSLTTGTRIWSYNDANPFKDWDVLTTNNWSGGDSLFANGDSVVFNDSSVEGAITIVGEARPAAVTFDNSVTDFTITPVNSNPNPIAGAASITKLGTATATLAGANTFTGGATIQAGTLAFANGGLGTYGPITMDGGTLRWHGSNNQDISRRLFLVDGKTATFDTGSNNVSFNTSLGGSTTTTASVVKNGSGILTLTNSFSRGTYTGGTTVNGGTLSLGSGGTGNFTCAPDALGSGLVTINAGARVRLWIQNTQTHAIANNFAIDGGRLHAEDGIYNVNGTIAVGAGGATFSAVYGGKNLILNGVISGTGPVTVEPTGAQIRFFGNNTHTGTVALSNGSLLLNNNQVSSSYTLASGTNLVLRSATVAGNITGAGAVTKDISTFGSSTINGTNNDYTGATTVNISLFTVGAVGVINGTSSITVQAQWGAGFNNLGSVTTPGNISVAGTGNTTNGGVTTDSSTFRNAGTVNAASILLNSSASTNTTANRGGTYTQTAGATTSSTTITLSPNGGTGAPGTAGNDAVLNLSGGTLASPSIAVNSGTLTATAGTITLGSGGLTSTGTNTIAVNLGATTLAASAPWSATLALTLTDASTGTNADTTGGNITLTGVISGSGGMNKIGSGTLTLSGINTYAGATKVNAGTLALTGDGTISDSSSVTIAAGAKLDTTAKTGTYSLSGETISFGLDAAGSGTSGQIDAAALNISGAIASLNITGSLDDPQYVLANYTSLTGTFAVAPPTGYAFDYGTGTNSQIKLVQAAGYDSWKTQITNGETLRTEDADDDGFTNLQEFLFGTDPMVGNGTLSTTEKSGNTLIIRWKQRTSGASYLLKESATLTNPWANSSAAVSNDGSASGDYQPRKAEVTIGAGSLFFRVEGTEN